MCGAVPGCADVLGASRNPRVKKRTQHARAVKRRKGQVVDVRVGEGDRYGGEVAGINARVSRARQLH